MHQIRYYVLRQAGTPASRYSGKPVLRQAGTPASRYSGVQTLPAHRILPGTQGGATRKVR
jgi:hypothetical protein